MAKDKTVRELITELEELADTHGDEAIVRIAHQPSWPFELTISEVLCNKDCQVSDDPDEGEDQEQGDADPVIYLAEGRQHGYLPGYVKRQLGWGRDY